MVLLIIFILLIIVAILISINIYIQSPQYAIIKGGINCKDLFSDNYKDSIFKDINKYKNMTDDGNSITAQNASKYIIGSILTIPKNIKIIKEGAFMDNNKFNIILFDYRIGNMPELIIQKKAFYGSVIKKLIIPPFVTYIGESAFTQYRPQYKDNDPKLKSISSKLKYINFDTRKDNLPKLIIDNGAFFRTYISDIIIPPFVTYIGEEAFSHCYYLIKITFMSRNDELICGKDSFFTLNHGVNVINMPKYLNKKLLFNKYCFVF